MPNLVLPLLDIHDVLGIDLVRAVHSHGYLIHIVGDTANELVYAKSEQDNGVLPELTTHIEDIGRYDTIFVVYPAWWYTMPQAVYSFFDEYDLSGKTIVPCATHAGSRLAGAPSTIEELEPNATVISDGFSVPASDVAGAENDVTEWLEQLGF